MNDLVILDEVFMHDDEIHNLVERAIGIVVVDNDTTRPSSAAEDVGG